VAGGAIVASCIWWIVGAYRDFSHVSPIHWGLLAPYASLHAVPVGVGLLAGSIMLLTGRGGKALLLAFTLTAIQAVAVTSLTPGLHAIYEDTVHRSLDTLRWSPPAASSPDSSAQVPLE
jgi:hypothetical protein